MNPYVKQAWPGFVLLLGGLIGVVIMYSPTTTFWQLFWPSMLGAGVAYLVQEVRS